MSDNKTPDPLVAENLEFKAKQRAKGRKLDRSGLVVPRDARFDTAMQEFWGSVDWADMRSALSDADDKAALELATYMARNYKSKFSLTKAARNCGISLQKLNDLYRNHNLAKAQIIVSAHLPKIAEDTAVDAEAKFEVCDRCDGLGTIIRGRTIQNDSGEGVFVENEEQCPRCKGEREVRVAGDAKARDQVFEIAGMTGKPTGPLVAIQQNFSSDDLEGTLNIAQKLLQQPMKGSD